MNIGVITYNSAHLKTEQILLKLNHSRYNVSVYALPFTERKARTVAIKHRPSQSHAAHPSDICKYIDIPFYPVKSDTDIFDEHDYYLITGAGILSAEFVKNKNILNCHPGIIPAARGLDAFKWTLYFNLPLGNTLHYIDAEVDSGDVISVVETPRFPSDTIDSLARRHYEREIDTLINFEHHIRHPVNDYKELVNMEPKKRMSFEKELELLRQF